MNQHSFFQSFGFAFEGIFHALKDNRNLRIHFAIAILVFILAAFLKVTSADFAMLVVMTILVISAEMINTSLEEMVDLITTEHRKEAKIAKDVAAGMVLVTSFGAAIVGAIILLPYLLPLIGY